MIFRVEIKIYIQWSLDNKNSDNWCSSRTRTNFLPLIKISLKFSPITRTVFRFPVEFDLPGSTVHTYKAKFTQKCINY